MLSLKYSLKCCTWLNYFEFGFKNPIEKEIEKKLENPEKKKRRKQPSRPNSAQPDHVLARVPPLTAGPRLSAAVPALARPPSLAHYPVDPTCRHQLLRPLVLPLSLYFAGPLRQCRAVAPARPLFSLCAVGPPCQIRLPRARRGLARSHSRTSPGFSATTPGHAPNSLLIAPPVPRTRPSAHFTHPRPLSRSALAARRRWRPTLTFPTVQLARDRTKPSRALPQGETSVPVPNFPYCALCSSNFAFAGARPRRSTVLARWPVDLVWFSSPE
jgi:hypothetical protein